MKTRTYISMLTLSGLIMVSCTSSLQVSNSSSWNDEIYGTTAKPQTQQVAQNESNANLPGKKVDSNLNQLEQKYSDVLATNTDSIKSDTVVYKDEETNPYRRVLSDSYEESYERRLRGFEDPWYGMNNWSVYLSDDYRYAQAYDPAYYRVVVMGNQVWVEPWYISAMFGWPRTSFSIGWGYGYGWNYSYWNYYPWHWYWGWDYPYNYYSYGYSPWYSSSYWWGWNNGYYYGSNVDNGNYYYGRRSLGTTNNTFTRRTSTGITKASDDQIASTRRRDGTSTTSTNPIVSTRRTQTRVTPTYENGSTQVAGSRRRTTTGTSGVTTQNEHPTRTIGISEPTRRSYNSSYDRPRTSSGNETSRRVENSNSTSRTVTRQAGTTQRGSSTQTYNRPNRVSTPSGSGNDNYRRSSGNSTSGGSGKSYSPTRSSSSGSSSSSRPASSSSSSSSSSSRRR